MADIFIAGFFGSVIGYLASLALFGTLWPRKVEQPENSDSLDQRYRDAEGGQ